MDTKTYSITKTNFAAVADTLVIDVRELNSVLLTLSGTYTFTLVFEGSDDNGTTWFPIQMAMVNANTNATSHATANASQAYEASCHAFTTIRARCSAWTSAGTHRVAITGTSAMIEPAPNNPVTTVTVTQPSPSAINTNSAATTNATSTKTTAGSLFEITASNMSAAVKYVKLYNKASAPTVGTDVPVLTIPVPANGVVSYEFGANGKRFTTGIAFAITGAQAIADTTAVAAGDVQVHGSYI
jgi:hypothetical protein